MTTKTNQPAQNKSENGKRRKILIIFCGAIIAATCLYYFFHGFYFAYCSDAYIRAHIIEIAPRVKGHLISVLVKNNQSVKKGDLLMEIDPTPYKLLLDVKRSSLNQQTARLKILLTKYKMAKTVLAAVKDQYQLALKKKHRMQKLSGENVVSKQKYEDSITSLDHAKNKLTEAQEECEFWFDSQAVQVTVIDTLKSEVALAEYTLSQTKIKAPADGFIVNINSRPGDYAQPGEAIFGILEDQEWWVKSNYKESVITKIKPGQKVWITTEMYPFTIFEGEVVNIGRAISRSPVKEKIIPYVQPTTDWIRLQRRFQVRIKFNNIPKGVRFHMGADARTFIFL